MKKQSAETTANGLRNLTAPECDDSKGPLTGIEMEEIREAYRDGCRGEVIIGLRGEERVITILIPAQSGAASPSDDLAAKLRDIGCDAYYRITAARP